MGILDQVPKLMALRLLEPVLAPDEPMRPVCHEDRSEKLLADLVMHKIDVVITDAPANSELPVRVFNHKLGECGALVYGSPSLCEQYGEGFPASLDDAPFLMPSARSTLRRLLDAWFVRHDIQPRIVGEFDDSALLEEFGQRGVGLFAAPDVIRDEIRRQFQVQPLGELSGITERFYAVSAERRLVHPGVLAISTAARETVFDPEAVADAEVDEGATDG